MTLFFVIGEIFFMDSPSFNSTDKSLLTLFNFSLGNSKFSIFDNIMKETVGYIFFILWSIVSAFMLMNLLIAMLTNVFTKYEPHSVGLYLKEIITIRLLNKYDEHYGVFMCTIFPFNIVFMPLFLPMIFIKSKKYNKFLMHLLYSEN